MKKTYGKKSAWEAGSSHAFDEAKLQSTKTNPSKIIRPSIWAKVPLIETFIAEPPPKIKKRSLSATKLDFPELEDTVYAPKKGRKRKLQDPFGFGDVDDEVLPASQYISPKRKLALEKPRGIKKSKAKKIKMGGNAVSNRSPLENNSTSYGSPKHKGQQPKALPLLGKTHSPMKRGRPPKNSLESVKSPTKDKSIPMKAKGAISTPSPKKRGRPPKHVIESPARALKELSKPVTPGGTSVDQSPKKRGRPPKNSSQSPANKLGIMSNSLTPDKKVASPSQKKRGRPPYSQISSPISPVTVSKTSVTKKTSKLIQKRKGGPPKDGGSVSPKSDGKAEHSSPKKRGRPPKSPISVSGYNNDTQNSSQSLKSEGTSGTPSPKKRRGRPPKIKSQETPTSSSNTLEHQNETQQLESERNALILVPKRHGRPPKSSTLASEVVSDLIDKNKISDLDSGIYKSPLSIDNHAQAELVQERSSTVCSESVIQVIDGAPLIKKKRGRKQKASLTDSTGASSPALHQEAAQVDDSSYLSNSALSSQPHSSIENSSLDPDEPTVQTNSEESSKKVRFSTDIAHDDDDDDIEISSSKASTSSATGVCFFIK